MKDTFTTKLHLRELSDPAVRSKSYRKLYTDRRLINDLDIVNELDGHSGCVNALAWSKSGNLLASGSDDQHLNIHAYQPENSDRQFQLSATVATGHTQNIFSVKFMPHSNDRTVITAVGDAQVRVFDLEYAGQSSTASAASTIASEGRRRNRNALFNGVRYLSDGDTNARVYKSHGDRVKRIVTESSPHLFLTCSEDGEVRQWDLRQPSSAYPEPRGSRMSSDSNVPPPLISYKRYSLDLNTISCSASQPHYIALGGAHLHAFLHDRRMTGRDKLKEMGRSLSPISKLSADEQDMLSQATQCVRKFSPDVQKKMKRADTGHITALKISDARPDEMIVSWSGDHIYSFDLHRDPEAKDDVTALNSHRAKESRDRKRKRKANGSEASLGQDRASSKPRTESTSATRMRRSHGAGPSGEHALRIRYQNGQSEDVPLPSGGQQLTERQRDAQRIAKAIVKIRSSFFGKAEDNLHPTAQFTTTLGHAASILSDIDETMREWGYPMFPEPTQVYVQQTLRRNRERTRRFVQAAGCISRALGGQLRTPSGVSPMMAQFSSIETRTNDLEFMRSEQFGYDFLKAILAWLDSGIGRLVEVFTRPGDTPSSSKAANRLPIPEAEATVEAVDEYLIPYLLRLASDEPIINPEANRFETADSRALFRTEKQAVLAFARALKIPFEDLSSAAVQIEGEEDINAQDRQTALRFWARKVGRGLLLNAAEGVNYLFVDRSFGGIGRVVREVAAEEALVDLLHNDGDEDEEDVSSVELIDGDGHVVDGATAEDVSSTARELRQASHSVDEEMIDTSAVGAQESHELLSPETAMDPEEDDDDDDDADEEDEDSSDDDEEDQASDSSSLPDEEDGVPAIGVPRFIYRSAFERRKLRPKVEATTPCSGPIRKYQGHCNVRTVKDVNYFGPDDEYVVSGSDDGNFFIWDRKTSELVNVLEGDGEVVNVIQGHPYETMLAVSGIDHTIKVFSPDARSREIARLGQGVSAHDASSFSSVAWPMRVGRRRRTRRESSQGTTSEPAFPDGNDGERAAVIDDEDYVAATGLSSRKRMHDVYRITQNNNMEREGGNQEAVITLPHAHLLQLLFGQLGNMPNFE